MIVRRPAVLIAFGAALIVAGFAYDLAFAGLPFQDPTPDQQARWETHKAIANWVILGGIGLFCLGVGAAALGGITRLVRRAGRFR